MFDSGKEVVTNRNPEACAEQVQYYLAMKPGDRPLRLQARHGFSVITPVNSACKNTSPSWADIFEKLAKNSAILQAYTILSPLMCQCGYPKLRVYVRHTLSVLRTSLAVPEEK